MEMRAIVMYAKTVSLILISQCDLTAQITDTFKDGNFTDNPIWSVSVTSDEQGDFIIQDEELQSKGPDSSEKIWISTNGVPKLGSGSVSWSFDVRYLFAPSGSNNVKVFLLSSKSDLNANPEGYFIQLGQSGSSDGINLMKTSSSNPLISDQNPSIANSIDVSIEVIRTSEGVWSLSYGENNNKISIGSATDNEFVDSGYFGFLVSHTKSRKTDFHFDNIEVAVADNTPPVISSVEIIDRDNISVQFSEILAKEEALNPENYLVNQEVVKNIDIDTINMSRATLDLKSPLKNGVFNKLEINELTDLSGNTTPLDTVSFLYLEPTTVSYKDIIITEVLADPVPPNDLPEAEFVELYNSSDKIFDLESWEFCDATRCSSLASFLLFPAQRVILYDIKEEESFKVYNNTIGLVNWPTLNNGGDHLVIKDNLGNKIDSLSYSDQWFTSSSKREGGWSLELIDPMNFCSDQNNWTDAINNAGGTPGRENSVNAQNPDLIAPKIVSAFSSSPDSISIIFDENLDDKSISRATYLVKPAVEVKESSYSLESRTINLKLADSLTSGIEYEIQISNITDCTGNVIRSDQNSAIFHLLEDPRPGDLIINEILFNPKSGGKDFVEIYNVSNKHLNLRKLGLGNFVNVDDSDEITVENIRPITEMNLALEPSRYLAITTDALILAEQFPQAPSEPFLQIKSLPSMPDDAGNIVLLGKGDTIIDKFGYLEDYHSPSVSNKEGVSLERISFNEVTQKADNWTSAIPSTNYGTPGYQNSQSRSKSNVNIDDVQALPEIINLSDPQNSFTTISYSLSQSGGLANLRIFDVYGRLIKNLAQNELLASTGSFKWDGYNEEVQPVRNGYYVIHFEVFYPDGNVRAFKRKIAVTNQF